MAGDTKLSQSTKGWDLWSISEAQTVTVLKPWVLQKRNSFTKSDCTTSVADKISVLDENHYKQHHSLPAWTSLIRKNTCISVLLMSAMASLNLGVSQYYGTRANISSVMNSEGPVSFSLMKKIHH